MSAGQRLTVHLDGGSRGNPGLAGAGVVLADAQSGEPVHEAGYFLGQMTNNVAEYRALLKALALARELSPTAVTIYSDSELMVRQLTGQYRVKSKDLKPLFERAQRQLIGLGDWSIRHVRRQFNERADALANLAMDAAGDVVERDDEGLAAKVADDEPPGGGDQGSFFSEAAGPAQPGEQPRRETDASNGDGPSSSSPGAGSAKPSARGWSVELAGPGPCKMGCAIGAVYPIDATTPAGLCVHAAAAAFAADPLHWPASLTRGETQCQHCGMTVQIAIGDNA